MTVCLLHEYVDDPDCPLCDYGEMLDEIDRLEPHRREAANEPRAA